MRKTKILLALLILMSSSQVVPLQTESAIAMTNDYSDCDWPMRHRTPDGNRIVPVQCAPGLGQLETAWELKLGQNIQHLVVAEDKVFFVTASYKSEPRFVECYNALNGTMIWKTQFSGNYLSDFLIFKGMLFFASYGCVYSIISLTGEIAWERKLISQTERITYYKDSIFFCNADEGVVSLDPYTGDSLWTIPLKSKARPVDISINDDSLYAIAYSDWKTDKSYIYRIDLSQKTVEIIFEMEGQGLYNLNVFDDCLCFADYSGIVYCLDANQKSIRWSMETNGYLGIRKMIFKNGLLYFNEAGSFDFSNTYGSSVFCIDIETGKVVWQNDHGIDYFSEMFMFGNILMYGTRYKGLMVANAITGQIINKTVEENFALYPLAISKKLVFVSKWGLTGNSLVCMREKVCK